MTQVRSCQCSLPPPSHTPCDFFHWLTQIYSQNERKLIKEQIFQNGNYKHNSKRSNIGYQSQKCRSE